MNGGFVRCAVSEQNGEENEQMGRREKSRPEHGMIGRTETVVATKNLTCYFFFDLFIFFLFNEDNGL